MTAYPKGLVPDLEYDVRFDLDPLVEKRTGADLMARGIVPINGIAAGLRNTG